MNRFLLFVIVLLIGANGYTYYQKWRFASAFDQREELLLDAQRRLEAKAYILEVRGDSLRAEIELLSQRLAGTRLTVESLRKKTGLDQRLQRDYPELGETAWGVVEVYDDESRRYLEYMAVPLWMSETFIVDHQNARLCR